MSLSNTLTNIIPIILARGLAVLRGQMMMTRLVNLDYSNEARLKGDTIDVPISSARTVSNVTPAAVASDPEDSAITKVQIPLDNWKKVNFGLTDDELNHINADATFIPGQVGESFKAMGDNINQDLFAEYKGIYGYVGTAGTTPFGSGVAVTSATDCRKILNLQLAPRDMRRMILDNSAESVALALAAYSDAEKVGSSDVKISGEIGKKFGFDTFSDNDVPTHTAGDLGGTGVDTVIKSATAHAIGVTTLTITVGATNDLSLLEGDIITIAGDDQTYVVTTATGTISATADGSVLIQPPLKIALTGAEVIVLKATHVVNLAFHKDAFALAVRAPGQGLSQIPDADRNVFTLNDPITGVIMRLEILKLYKQTTWEIDALWGGKLVRPELAVRLAG
jgi:hypothetical protein